MEPQQLHPPTSDHREVHAAEGGDEHGLLRGRPRRQQDRDPRAVEKLFGVKVARRPRRQPPGEVEAHGPVHRPAQGLEEGLRAARRRARSRSSSSRGCRRYARQEVQTDFRGAPFPDALTTSRSSRRRARRRRLTVGLRSTGGRNNQGRHHLSRFMGGGHKRLYRIIDFRRDKMDVPAKVAAIEYDPNRTARIALLHYADGEKRYILAPNGLEVGAQRRRPDPRRTSCPATRCPLKGIPLGTTIHNIELKRGNGGQLVRSAGAAAQLMAKEGELRAGAPALGRGPRGPHRVLRDDRPGRQPRARERLDRQGRPQPLAGPPPARPRRRDEPGRPPDGRRRRQDVRRTPPDLAVGLEDEGHQDPQQQADGRVHRPPPQGEGARERHGTFDQEGPVRRRPPHRRRWPR